MGVLKKVNYISERINFVKPCIYLLEKDKHKVNYTKILLEKLLLYINITQSSFALT